MRILKTTQTYYPYLSKGGPPASVRGLASALVSGGHDVTILTADLGEPDGDCEVVDWKPTKGEWGRQCQHDGINAIYLRALARYRTATLNRHLLTFCFRRIAGFDIVHIYGLYDLIGPVVARFCRRRGIPYVIEPLGMFHPKVRSLHKKRLYHALVGNSLFRGAAVVIATSETERAELIEGGICAERIVVRRNGLDLSEFRNLPKRGAFRAKVGIGKDQILILFLGRISFIKGLDLLVQAFAGTGDARLVIAGPDDDDGCMQRVRNLIDEQELRDRVIISAPLYGTKKLQAFVDADVFVLPSRYESFGNAAAESIACGTPALVTKECGIAPLIEGRAGLVAPCTTEGLRDAINRLLGDPALLSRLRSGCADVARGFSWDEPVETMEAVYAAVAMPEDVRFAGALKESQVRGPERKSDILT